MSKIIKGFTCILMGLMLVGANVSADGSASVMETCTNDSDISVYIKGTEVDVEDINVQISISEAENVSVQSISELDIPMQTLVMIDNSLSISSNDRDKIAEFLQNLISDRISNEEICIATFSEELNKLNEYSGDYADLKQAVGSISYQNQETYLTDVLYDLICNEYVQSSEDIYRRIILVSDGVDNKSLGYTKDELYSLLNDIKIPIYTIGCVNGKNNDELENMFALSRMTLSDYFLLDDVEDVLDITNTLNQDRQIKKLVITPPGDLLDGSKKTVKITFPDNFVITVEIVMPQQIYVSEPEKTSIVDEEVVEEERGNDEAVETEIPIRDKEKLNINYSVLIIIGMSVIAAIGIVIVILSITRKKKKPEAEFEGFDDGILKELGNNVSGFNEKTEVVVENEGHDSDKTVLLWNQNAAKQVILTDINSPIRSFQVPLNQSIIVGRKTVGCDIVLDYDKSVSRRHCEISVRNNKFYIRDLQSTSGTFLNGSKVLTETEIFSGNILKLGRLEMRFEVK